MVSWTFAPFLKEWIIRGLYLQCWWLLGYNIYNNLRTQTELVLYNLKCKNDLVSTGSYRLDTSQNFDSKRSKLIQILLFLGNLYIIGEINLSYKKNRCNQEVLLMAPLGIFMMESVNRSNNMESYSNVSLCSLA